MADMKVKVLGFFSKYKRDKVTGNTREIDFVRFSPAQAMNAQITEERVHVLRPKEDDDDEDGDRPNRAAKRMHMQAIWSVVGPAYDAWKKGYEIPDQGTPLAAWAGITRDQADALRKVGVMTVEELSALDDNKLPRLPMPNAREVRELARKYLTTGDDTKIADRMADMERENAAIKEQLAAAMELLEQQTKPKKAAKAEAEKEAA